MEDLAKQPPIQVIGIETILNCLLVKEGVRPGYLFQIPEHFSTPTKQSKKNRKIRGKTVKKLFPDLKLTEEYQGNQGIIVSKKEITGIVDTERMGEILGYPCAKGFDTLNRDKITYSIRIYATTSNGRFEIFTNICQTKKHISAFRTIAKQAKQVFKKYEAFLSDFNLTVYDVKIEIEKNVSDNYIINKLLRNIDLNETDKAQASNSIWNNIGEKTQTYFDSHFQFHNPKHVGILIDILLNIRVDVMSPFYPLQTHPEFDAVSKLLIQRDEEMVQILKRSEIKKTNY